VLTALSNPVSFTPLVGRRYRISGNMRAMAASGPTTGGYLSICRDGAQWVDTHAPLISGVYNHSPVVAYADGDGVARSWDLRFMPQVATNTFVDQESSYFVIEDVGPAAGSVPIANPNPAYAKGYLDKKTGAGSNTSTSATWVLLPGTDKAVAFLATRRYRIVGHIQAGCSVAGDWLEVGVFLNGGPVAISYMNGPGAGYMVDVTFEDTFVVAAGTWVVDCRFGRYFGSGTVSNRADIIAPSWTLYDVGPA
jgi:hypothetical protein